MSDIADAFRYIANERDEMERIARDLHEARDELIMIHALIGAVRLDTGKLHDALCRGRDRNNAELQHDRLTRIESSIQDIIVELDG